MRRGTKIGLGLILVGLAIQLGWLLWGGTRHWVPVDMQVTLSPGHITTREFKVNISAPYVIEIVVQKNMPFDTLNCLLGIWSNSEREPRRCENTSSVIEATWTLFSGTRIIAQGTSNGADGAVWAGSTISRDIGDFQGEYGRSYTLDVNILKDGSRLANCNPRLEVAVENEWAKGILFWRVTGNLVTTVLWLVGIPILLISVLRGHRKKTAATSSS
jgi:hypothetical protein